MRQQPNRPTDEHNGDHVVVFDIESIVEDEPADGGFPKWPSHKPVVASFLSAGWAGRGQYAFEMASIVCEPGRETDFYAAVNGKLAETVTSVSFNGRGYDLPVLQLGAIAQRRFDLPGLSAHARAHRFGRLHCDLAEMFSGYGGTKRPSLAEVCGPLGIPIKTSTDGSKVGELWRAGEVEKIRMYCEEDVAASYTAWLHHHAWRHSNEALIARPLAAFARHIECTPELVHLLPFAHQPAAMWARPRALAMDVGDALAAADRRVTIDEDERAFSPSERSSF